MNSVKLTSAGLIAVMALTGCASTPTHPMVQVVPPANKPFQVFQADQAACEDYAHSQVAGEAEDANGKAVGAALIGAALGAGLGAAAGGGHGAGVGAAVGGTAGTAIGAGQSSNEGRSLQVRYDNAYAACMTSKGNIVPQTVVHHPVTVVQQPVYVAPAPTVVYTAPPAYYAPPPGAVAAPGYAPPPGAAAPPPNMPAPQ
jgi:outer membrane lipoprotein SlyB